MQATASRVIPGNRTHITRKNAKCFVEENPPVYSEKVTKFNKAPVDCIRK